MRKCFTLAVTVLSFTLAACGDAPLQPEPAAPAAARAPAGSPGGVTTSSVLTVSNLICNDLGGGGIYYNNTECSAAASGGTGIYTMWEWDVIVTSGDENSPYITGVCTDSYPVTVTVTDSSGATASLSRTFPCGAKSSGGGGLDP